MPTFFAFSDESGDYKSERDKKFISSNPYYVRATFIIRASDWKNLNQQFLEVKRNYNLPLEKEIKWSYIWNLHRYQARNTQIPSNKPYYFLHSFDYRDLIKFVDSTLSLYQS